MTTSPPKVWEELLQIAERLQIEKQEWESLQDLDLPEYKTSEEWLDAAIKSGRTVKSAEELTKLVARLTKISEDFETAMERLKRVVKKPNKGAQLRRTLEGVFPFAQEDDLREVFSLESRNMFNESDSLKEREQEIE